MSDQYKAPALSEPLHPIRLSDPMERTLREEWVKYVDQTNFDLLSGPIQRWHQIPKGMDREPCPLTGGYEPFPHGRMTDRDHMLARELMQWIGTPCGFSFITMVFRKVGYHINKEGE